MKIKCISLSILAILSGITVAQEQVQEPVFQENFDAVIGDWNFNNVSEQQHNTSTPLNGSGSFSGKIGGWGGMARVFDPPWGAGTFARQVQGEMTLRVDSSSSNGSLQFCLYAYYQNGPTVSQCDERTPQTGNIEDFSVNLESDESMELDRVLYRLRHYGDGSVAATIDDANLFLIKDIPEPEIQYASLPLAANGIEGVLPAPGAILDADAANELQIKFSAASNFQYTEHKLLKVVDKLNGREKFVLDLEPGYPGEGTDAITISIPANTLDSGTPYDIIADATLANVNISPWKTGAIVSGNWEFSTSGVRTAPVQRNDVLPGDIRGITTISPEIGSVIDAQSEVLVTINFGAALSYDYTAGKSIRLIDNLDGSQDFTFDPEPGHSSEGERSLTFAIPAGVLTEGTSYSIVASRGFAVINQSPWRVDAIPENTWVLETSGTRPEPEPPTEPEEPDAPAEPEEPEEPMDPGTPTEPDEPTVPEEPPMPQEPGEPEEPTEPGAPVGAPQAPQNPIIFVTQVPFMGTSDFAIATSAFGNHRSTITRAPRGGSLMIRYADGEVVDLLDKALKAACDQGSEFCNEDGSFLVNDDGLLVNGYAVRDPDIHWDGNKVLFSLAKGTKERQYGTYNDERYWQMVEITGLAKDAVPVLSKVANQPANYNNVAAVYGSQEGVFIFTTDRPITGEAHLYPQLDEYESTPTVSGLWKLDATSGELTLLDHSPSGAFDPLIGQDGMVYYTRWDHLQQDQQASLALRAVLNPDVTDYWKANTYASEGIDEQPTPLADQVSAYLDNDQVSQAFALDGNMLVPFHASHPVYTDRADIIGNNVGSYNGQSFERQYFVGENGRETSLRFNIFVPWQITQDGEKHETFRHVGRHEFHAFFNTALLDDENIRSFNSTGAFGDGFFQMHENPGKRNEFIGVNAPEFATHASGNLIQMRDLRSDSVHEQGSQVVFEDITEPGAGAYRNPLWLTQGDLVAVHDEIAASDKSADRTVKQFDFRLFQLVPSESGAYVKGDALVQDGLVRNLNYWNDAGQLRSYNGPLWELQPVEVAARPRPSAEIANPIPAPEQSIFDTQGVNVAEFKAWLEEKELALIVSRDVTLRDDLDRQQPFNLAVVTDSGLQGAETLGTGAESGKVYPVKHLEIMENKLVRGYERSSGRRGLPRPVDNADALAINNAVQGLGHSVMLEDDGSFAALVPAKRAVTWALSNETHYPVVRERYWVNFAAGEVRVCASCHGINDEAQNGGSVPVNPPKALEVLLENWRNR